MQNLWARIPASRQVFLPHLSGHLPVGQDLVHLNNCPHLPMWVKLSAKFYFPRLSSGSKCVTPLLPPTRHNLAPVWDKNNPPGRLDIRVVPSDQCYLRTWLHVNIQMFCRRSAQPTDIRLQSGHLQSDLPPRKSVLHPNLADLCCKYYTSLKKCIF